ncbi:MULTISPECIES: Gfo/Idh/MocA family protein [Paenibacillus]|uniref:Gfo/Idh/MocA family protein n=1 Tax=Paenibacillus residui TaxID=629724 RepID=A0ABW3D6D2_9BACL|nr:MULTISPECIES: Gfo/Idh/MocA family oxidoreductase [Paenibacillaceae]
MKLGVIGYGARISHVIDEIIRQDPSCRIAAITDIRKDKVRQEHQKLQDVTFYDSAEQMLDSEKLDGVLIGTRCSLHTELALKVLPTGLPLFLEKPVATTLEDLHRLQEGYRASRSQVVVSFPLRVTTIVQKVKEIIDSGQLGTIEHAQAINNVPYGGVYYHNWYRDEAETGGLFLQKATHDFDYITYLLQNQPESIAAMTSKQIFKGSKPAGLQCADCEENRTCPESTAFRSDLPDTWKYCCFAEDTGNEDSGSALIRFKSGMHLSYSQNFFVRNEAGARGARFMGFKGTVEFDFYTKQVKVMMHHEDTVKTYEINPAEGHFGGDTVLARNFIDVMRGQAESVSTLDDGLLSALMCLKAKQSAETGTFQAIDWIPVRAAVAQP